jgi:HlyD family secretion protein
MRKRALLPVFLLVAALGVLAWWLFWRDHELPEKVLRLSGHIEATEVDLAFKVPGTISAIRFEEGEWVKAGDVVATLEAKDLKDGVAVAEAGVAAAMAAVAKMESGSRRQEIREAEAAVTAAKAELDNQEANFKRIQALFDEKVATAKALDQARTDLVKAQEVFHSAQELLDLRKEGSRQEDIAAARAELKLARAKLELAQTRLGYATLTSPVNGVVLVRPAEVGEVAAVGSVVLTIGELDKVWFEGYLTETDLGRVTYGQKAVITTDTFPAKRYPAVVSFISSQPEFTPKSVETRKERVTLVYRTKIRGENPGYELKPGMPAEAVIDIDGQ